MTEPIRRITKVEDAVSVLYGCFEKDEKALDVIIADEAVLLYFTINNMFLTGDDGMEIIKDCVRLNPNLPNVAGPINENAAGFIKDRLRKRILDNYPEKRINQAYLRRNVASLRNFKWYTTLPIDNCHRDDERSALGALSTLYGMNLKGRSRARLFDWIVSWAGYFKGVKA